MTRLLCPTALLASAALAAAADPPADALDTAPDFRAVTQVPAPPGKSAGGRRYDGKGPLGTEVRVHRAFAGDMRGNTWGVRLCPNNPRVGCPVDPVEYLVVRPGDVVAGFGGLYRVAVLADDEAGPGWGGLRLTRLPREKWPPGVGFGQRSVALPLSDKPIVWTAKLYGLYVEVVEMVVPPDFRVPAVALDISPDEPSDDGAYRRVSRATCAAGMWLRVGRAAHRVVAVVPRDEAKGIAGWVELDGDPADADDLAKRKAYLVGPTDWSPD